MFKQLLGDPNSRKLKRFSPLVTDINILEDEISILTDEDLRRRTYHFQNKLKKITNLDQQILFLDELLPEVFAVVREASKRTINERPYDVQMIGSIVLHEGKIAEMKTGEGKTLTIV